MKNVTIDSLKESRIALDSFLSNSKKIVAIENAASLLIQTLKRGNSIYSCGNGGSMSDAMHFAEELTGCYRKDRPGLSATAISDPGYLSCVANDYGYEHVFSRYLQARGKELDCLLAISTSGESLNVINAAKYAQEHRMKVISLTGKSNSILGKLSTVEISTVERKFSDKVQEIHIKIIHTLIELIERHFFPENY